MNNLLPVLRTNKIYSDLNQFINQNISILISAIETIIIVLAIWFIILLIKNILSPESYNLNKCLSLLIYTICMSILLDKIVKFWFKYWIWFKCRFIIYTDIIMYIFQNQILEFWFKYWFQVISNIIIYIYQNQISENDIDLVESNLISNIKELDFKEYIRLIHNNYDRIYINTLLLEKEEHVEYQNLRKIIKSFLILKIKMTNFKITKNNIILICFMSGYAINQTDKELYYRMKNILEFIDLFNKF